MKGDGSFCGGCCRGVDSSFSWSPFHFESTYFILGMEVSNGTLGPSNIPLITKEVSSREP